MSLDMDQAGRPVRLACVGYFAPKNVGQDIPAMAAAGFNCVRYPWYNATLADHLPVMDAIVEAANIAGLKVIFDHHGDETPSAANNYLPYPCNARLFNAAGWAALRPPCCIQGAK